MEIRQIDNNLILTGVKDFCLEHIFDCGQCFRWEKESDGSYVGIAYNTPLKIAQSGDTVTLYNTSIGQFNSVWFDYFDFGTDYSPIKTRLSEDTVLKNAVSFGGGIRILNQELWECTVSFIISQSNNIPRIKKIISTLCENYGDKTEYLGQTFYTFPSPEKILYSAGLDGLSCIKAGFRDKYILSAAEFFVNGFSKAYFDPMTYDEAKKELLRIKGIGSKVADCILLFGLGKRSSFPVDVWIKRIIEYYYFDSEQTVGRIEQFAKERFSSLGGYAQQYLFYYARENKIGTEKQ